MGLYFQNDATKKRYDVVHFDQKKGEVTLKCPDGEFTEKFDKDKFQRMGYTLLQD